MLVNWKGIKRIFQTYKYKCHKLIQNLEFKYSAPRKYFSKCLAQAKVKCSLVYCCPMKDTLTEKAHSQSYRIPTAGYGMGIHPHLHAQTRALTCKPPTSTERCWSNTSQPKSCLAAQREIPQPRFDQVQINMQEGISSSSPDDLVVYLFSAAQLAPVEATLSSSSVML